MARDTYIWGAIRLLGGAEGDLDKHAYADLQDKDLCITAVQGDKIYHHIFDASSSAAESSPDVIAPDDVGANNGRWLLVAMYGAAASGANTDITSLGAHSLTGTLSLNEKTILIDTILASDGTWTGPTETITAGEELTIGEVAYLKSDGKYWHTDADAEATSKGKLIMATATISADGTGVGLLPSDISFLRNDATTAWTVTTLGETQYLSTTAGALTNDVSGYTTGDCVRIAGYMKTTTIINFNVGKDWLELV